MIPALDLLFSDETRLCQLRRARLGVLCHAASTLNSGVHLLDALREHAIPVTRIFSPEHGLWGAAQDMEGVPDTFDAIMQAHVTSLYGHALETLSPSDDALAGLDTILIDIQDVGSRYYTFVYTAWLLARAALERGAYVILADRPNPINAVDLEGNLVAPGFQSFVGMRSLMTRHAMTAAELLRMWLDEDNTPNRECFIPILMRDYDRNAYYDATGALWCMPSPNMPTLDTALVYPGMCLLEGTTLSEGRGTTRPFELFGAPWLNARATHEALRLLDLPGVVFRPLDFKPMFQKHANTLCHGMQMHVTDRKTFRPLLTGVAILSVIAALHEDFAWRTQTYEFVKDRLAIDLLFGNDTIRQGIEKQVSPYRLLEQMHAESAVWRSHRKDCLLYP